jgi:hypothetical protein
VKRYVPWLLPAAAAGALAPPPSGGFTLFHTAGRAFLSRDWSHAFSDSALQVGPFQLALFGSLGHFVGFAIAPALALLLVTVTRVVGVRQPQVLTLAGLVSIPLGLTSSGIDSGHPANALLPLLWVLAADRAHRGKTLTAAVIVGLSAGIETWGILGIAVLVLAPQLRSALQSASLAAGVATAIYLPFIVLGHFEMGSFEWLVSGDSLMSYVVDAGTPIGWPLRFLQGGIALGAGVALAHAARRSAHLLWLIPLVVVLVRVLLDPLGNGYYFVGIEGPALVGLALICCWGVRLPQLLLELRA